MLLEADANLLATMDEKWVKVKCQNQQGVGVHIKKRSRDKSSQAARGSGNVSPRRTSHAAE